MTIASKPLAFAAYVDPYAGPVLARLVEREESLFGVRCVAWRWVDPAGRPCDGLAAGLSAARMIAHATAHRRFSDLRLA